MAKCFLFDFIFCRSFDSLKVSRVVKYKKEHPGTELQDSGAAFDADEAKERQPQPEQESGVDDAILNAIRRQVAAASHRRACALAAAAVAYAATCVTHFIYCQVVKQLRLFKQQPAPPLRAPPPPPPPAQFPAPEYSMSYAQVSLRAALLPWRILSTAICIGCQVISVGCSALAVASCVCCFLAGVLAVRTPQHRKYA